MSDQKFTFQINLEDYEKLRKLAFEHRRSIAELIREAIQLYLADK